MPHDDNIYESIDSIYRLTRFSLGGDPGRDEVMFTDDDIDFQNALNEMRDNNITLFHVNSGGQQYLWKHWTGVTGGDSILLSDASQIPQVVLNLIEGLAVSFHLPLLLRGSRRTKSYVANQPGLQSLLSSVFETMCKSSRW